jgi:flagellar biosynthesis/type III secretory pathway chaperone
MDYNTQTKELLNSLENVLVQEFRTLQSLIAVTKEERILFNKKDPDAIMKVVEQKESLLDQLGLMEEKRRMFTTGIASELAIKLKNSSLNELFSGLDYYDKDRLTRLNDGIAMLVQQARDLNYGNQALAKTALNWLESAQTFLINISQPVEGYRPPGANPSMEKVTLGDMEMKV